MSYSHYQQTNVQRVDEGAALVAKFASCNAVLAAKRITAAVLMVICVVAAVLL
jgi:hypothetical protein